jgi:formylmethanofuran dehydrogenase subunit B
LNTGLNTGQRDAADAVPTSVPDDTGRAVPVESLVFGDAASDATDLAQALMLLVDGRALASGAAGGPASSASLAALAADLRASPYAVLVWEPAQLGPHAALVIERLQQVIARLNETTRAAALPIGGAQGGLTAQQVHTWLSGLPLRSRLGPRGLEHDPLRLGLARLLAADGGGDGIDALVWCGAFPAMPPPATGLPRVLLVSADVAATPGACGDESDAIVLPVASPGVQQGGHLFRTDTVVLMPLRPLMPLMSVPNAANAASGASDESALPSVAQVVGEWLALLASTEAAS